MAMNLTLHAAPLPSLKTNTLKAEITDHGDFINLELFATEGGDTHANVFVDRTGLTHLRDLIDTFLAT